MDLYDNCNHVRIRVPDSALLGPRGLYRLEPDAAALAALWAAWAAEHPEGGEVPLEAWSQALACSREAMARALGKLAKGRFTLTRKLEARP